jgi:hypothetical protein
MMVKTGGVMILKSHTDGLFLIDASPQAAPFSMRQRNATRDRFDSDPQRCFGIGQDL